MYVYGGGYVKLTIAEKMITKTGMIMYEQNIFKIYENHASIVGIQEHVNVNSPFQFTNVSVGEIKALLLDIDSTKATGYDTIPP